MSPGVERHQDVQPTQWGSKLNVLLLAAWPAWLLISALALYSKYQRMLEDRRGLAEHGAEVAVGVLNYHDRLVRDGSLPLASAKAQARRAIGELRYADKVFYIFDMHPRMVQHPIKPELNGRHQPDPRPGRQSRCSSPCAMW